MSEPTTEEREGGLALADLVVRELEMKDLLPSKAVDAITRYLSTLIRAAVETERERWRSVVQEALDSLYEDCGSLDIAPMARGVGILQAAIRHPDTPEPSEESDA